MIDAIGALSTYDLPVTLVPRIPARLPTRDQQQAIRVHVRFRITWRSATKMMTNKLLEFNVPFASATPITQMRNSEVIDLIDPNHFTARP